MIKISTRMKKFHFWVKYTVSIKNENEVLKNSDFFFQYVVQISERSNQYSQRYCLFMLYPIGITFFCFISIQILLFQQDMTLRCHIS